MSDASLEQLGEGSVVYCRFVQRTDVGKRRSENQDTHGYIRTQRGSVFIVADGMGGAQGGATASALAVEVLVSNCINDSGVASERSLREAIRTANRTIFDYAKTSDKLGGMGTTLVVLSLFPDAMYVAHVGDSRIYRCRDGGIESLTKDHTLVQELLDSGTLEPDQAENHPISHMLTRSLGPMPTVDAELNRLESGAEDGDVFLLCCDGLINHVNDDEIAKIVGSNSLEDAADMLIELANQRGGTDNITVQLVSMENGPVAGVDVLGPGETETYSSSELTFGDLDTLLSGGTQKESKEREGSAVDSIIFGEAPSTEELERQAREARSSSADSKPMEQDQDPEQDSHVKLEEFSDDEDDDDDDDDVYSIDSLGAEVTDRDFQSLHKLQLFGVGVIFTAVFSLLVVLMPRLFNLNQDEQVPNDSPVDAPEISSPIQEESTPEDQLEVSPVEQAELADPNEQSELSEDLESEDESSSDEAEKDWPVADVIPAQQATELLTDVGTVSPEVSGTGSESESSPETFIKSTPNMKIGELDFSVSKEEVSTIIKRKDTINKLLAEVILRRELLNLSSADALLQRQAEVERELGEIQQQQAEATAAITSLAEAYSGWQKKEGAVNSDDVTDLARELSEFDSAVGEALDRFSKASFSYSHVLEGSFKGTPQEKQQLTSVFTNARRTLAESVFVGIQNRLEVLRNELRGAIGTRYDLQQRQVKLESMLKVFPTHRAPLNLERVAREHSLEKEQSTLSAELRGHRLKVSDEQQRALHVEMTLHELGLN